MSELARNHPPSDKYVQYIYRLLNDFGITDIVVPKFSTISELEHWKKGIIMNFLNED